MAVAIRRADYERKTDMPTALLEAPPAADAKTEAAATSSLPELKPTTIPAPDLQSLKVIQFEPMLLERVTDPESLATARDHYRQAKDYCESVDNLLKGPTAAAHKLHKFFTGLSGQLKATAEAVQRHCRKEADDYEDREEAKRAALQAELDRQNREQADREQAERLASAMPWELAELLAEEPPLPAAVIIAPSEPTPGIRRSNKPLSYEVTNKRLLLESVLDLAKTDPDVLDAIEINDAYFKAKVKEMGTSIAKRFPGIEAVQGKRTSFR
jgi:hypothetical protein